MKIGILKETQKGEKRVALTPKIAKNLIANNFKIIVEEDAGNTASFKDSDYKDVGAKIEKRGVVVYPSDLTSLGCKKWVEMANEAGLNVIALHSDTRLETLPKLKTFLESEQGKIFLANLSVLEALV